MEADVNADNTISKADLLSMSQTQFLLMLVQVLSAPHRHLGSTHSAIELTR
jgi:hypothetical protein